MLANAADLSCLKVILDLSDPLVRFTLRSHQTCQIVSSKIQNEGITVLHYSDLIKFTPHQFRDGVQAMHLRLWRFKRWFHRVDECLVRLLSKALPLTTSMHPELPSPKFWFVISLTEDLSSSNNFSNIRQVDPQSS